MKVDDHGNLTPDEQPRQHIHVDRSSKSAWLNSLKMLYKVHLDSPEHAGDLAAYQAELASYNSQYPQPIHAPSDAQSMEYQAAKHLEAQAAFDASMNSSDPRVHQYSRMKLKEALANVPQLAIYGDYVCRSSETDNSPAHIEVVGAADGNDDLTPPPTEYFG